MTVSLSVWENKLTGRSAAHPLLCLHLRMYLAYRTFKLASLVPCRLIHRNMAWGLHIELSNKCPFAARDRHLHYSKRLILHPFRSPKPARLAFQREANSLAVQASKGFGQSERDWKKEKPEQEQLKAGILSLV